MLVSKEELIVYKSVLLIYFQTGAKDLNSYESERRPIAVYEFAGSLAIESKEIVHFS